MVVCLSVISEVPRNMFFMTRQLHARTFGLHVTGHILPVTGATWPWRTIQ